MAEQSDVERKLDECWPLVYRSVKYNQSVMYKPGLRKNTIAAIITFELSHQ